MDPDASHRLDSGSEDCCSLKLSMSFIQRLVSKRLCLEVFVGRVSRSETIEDQSTTVCLQYSTGFLLLIPTLPKARDIALV